MVDWAAHSRVSYERPPPRHEDNNDSTRALINGSQPEEEETDLKVAVKPFTVHILQLADVAKQTPAISIRNIRSLNSTYEQPLDSELILCTWVVWGFSFQSKLWCQYHVDNLVDVDFHKKSFDRLVLREDYKTILKAMVAQHFTQGQHRFQDLVAGKGQGLNILLHGLMSLTGFCTYAKMLQVRLEWVKHSQLSALRIYTNDLCTRSPQVI